MDNRWLSDTTLGGKHKEFYWKLDEECNILIKRKSKNWNIEKLTKHTLDQLNQYMGKDDWRDLANDVKKLSNGTEKDGIGSFLYELNSNTSYAQLSSHLASIFVHTGVWKYNEQKIGMKFLRISDNWCEVVKNHYEITLIGSL